MVHQAERFHCAYAARLIAAAVLVLVPSLSPAATIGQPLAGVRAGAGRAALGPILTADSQIFGFDIDQHGNDGLLATSDSVDTFDQSTGKITKVVALTKNPHADYVTVGIFAGDVGLVEHEVSQPNGNPVKRNFELLSPVTAETFTGPWTPPFAANIVAAAENQDTTTGVVYALDPNNNADLIVSNIGANTFSRVIALGNVSGFVGGAFAQDTLTNQAVFAGSPDGGAAGGAEPIIQTLDLATGKLTSSFQGVGPGDVIGSGSVNGLAVDSKTGIAVTSTELDGAIEFYDLTKQAGFQIFPPGNAGELLSESAIASDPMHQLFVVTQPYSTSSANSSSIYVYDERGNLVESLDFPRGFGTVGASLAIDPAKRLGWVNGPQPNQIQSFTY